MTFAQALVVLGLTPADLQDLALSARRRYRRLALLHHPDRGGDAEQFKRVALAYEVVKRAAVKAPTRTENETFYLWSMHCEARVGQRFRDAAVLGLALDRREQGWIETWTELARVLQYIRFRHGHEYLAWWPLGLSRDGLWSAYAGQTGQLDLLNEIWAGRRRR